MKINAWWKAPHGKLIGSPGNFFDHNRLWHPPGPVGSVCPGSRGPCKGGREEHSGVSQAVH